MTTTYFSQLIKFHSHSFYAEEPEELVDLQKKEWTPIMEWFNKKYDHLRSCVLHESSLSKTTAMTNCQKSFPFNASSTGRIYTICDSVFYNCILLCLLVSFCNNYFFVSAGIQCL